MEIRCYLEEVSHLLGRIDDKMPMLKEVFMKGMGVSEKELQVRT